MDLPRYVSPSQPLSLPGRRYARRCSVTIHSLRAALDLLKDCPDLASDPVESPTLVTDEVDSPPSRAVAAKRPVQLGRTEPQDDRKRQHCLSDDEQDVTDDMEEKQRPKRLTQSLANISAKKQKKSSNFDSD